MFVGPVMKMSGIFPLLFIGSLFLQTYWKKNLGIDKRCDLLEVQFSKIMDNIKGPLEIHIPY